MRNFKNNDKFENSFNNKIENLNLEFENKKKKKNGVDPGKLNTSSFLKNMSTIFLNQQNTKNFKKDIHTYSNNNLNHISVFPNDKKSSFKNKFKTFIHKNVQFSNSPIIHQFMREHEIVSLKKNKTHNFEHSFSKINLNVFNEYNEISNEKKLVRSKSYLNNFISEEDKNQKSENIKKLQSALKTLFKLKTENLIYMKKFSIFKGFSAVSFKNLEKLNEDKIHIGINNKFQSDPNKKLNFFAVYDGHKGDKVSVFLKDNFHKLLINNEKLYDQPEEAFFEVFKHLEKNILNNKEINSSGASVIALLNIEKYIYVANLGNCRAIISTDNALEVSQLSKEHNIYDKHEKFRIESYRGMIKYNKKYEKNYKIIPGNISITRCLGDIECKSKELGGIPNMISSIPDIIKIKYNENFDYIFLASSGIIEFLNNIDIAEIIYNQLKNGIIKSYSFEKTMENINQNIIYYAIEKGCEKNLSFIFLSMENLYKVYKEKKLEIINKILSKFKMTTNDKEDNYYLENKLNANNNNVLFTFIEESFNPKEKIKDIKDCKYKSEDNDDSEKSNINCRTKRTFYDENKKEIKSFSNSFLIKTNINSKISINRKDKRRFRFLCCK